MTKAEKSEKKFEAVVFVVNSPGGSPVYSSLIGDRVANFAKNRNVPYYTFADDVAASGGYWILCMGKSKIKVYADCSVLGDQVCLHPTSLIGSIGVVSQTLAFKGVLEKNKIELHQFRTGEKLIEAVFDPFGRTEIDEVMKQKLRAIQEEIF